MEKRIHSLSDIAEAIEKKNNYSDIILKFKSIDKGIKLLEKDPKIYKWENLISEDIPINILRTKVIELNKLIQALEPGINSNIAFFYTKDDTIIAFTWQDIKEFVIEAIKYRMNSPYYLKLQKEKEKALLKEDFKTVAKISRKLGI